MTIIVDQIGGGANGTSGYTFLQLVQRLVTEGGMTGGANGGPSTAQNQVGEFGRAVNWINDAWMEIQNMHQDWDWMRSSATVPTVTNQANYPTSQFYNINGVQGLTDFGKWDLITGRNYVTSEGLMSEVFMDYITYDQWRDLYYYGALRFTQSRPIVWSILPTDHSIVLGPVPLVGYTFEADYFRVPSMLINDTDIPILPPQWHRAILYKALTYYGEYEENDGVIDRNQKKFNKIMRQAMVDRLPQVLFGATLA